MSTSHASVWVSQLDPGPKQLPTINAALGRHSDVGDLEGVPRSHSQSWIIPALAITGIWGVNQWTEV